MADAIKTPDIYIYSDPKKNRKVGNKKGAKKAPQKYKATDQDMARKQSFSKVV